MKTSLFHFLSFLLVPLLLLGFLQPNIDASARAAVLAPAQVAYVKAAHFAPFAATVDETSVSVTVDGIPFLDNFKFGDVTPLYTETAAGVDHVVEITPTGGSTPIITKTVQFTEGQYYTVAAIGDGTNQPLELVVLADDNTRPASGARVRLAHFAISPILPPVDICTSDDKVLVANFVYKDVTDPYLEIPVGIYNLKLALAGTGCLFTIPVTIPPITIIDRTVVSVFAIGDTSIPANVLVRWDQSPIVAFIPHIVQ